jgi:hypothetical protein
MRDQSDNKKTTGNMAQDDFWDLDSMLPQSVRQAPTTLEGPRDTEAVEIAFGEDTDDGARELHIPPMPNITQRMQRAAQYRNGAARNPDRRTSPMPSHGNTPGDVSPQMAQPVCSYEPENSMIRQVSVFRWPERYQYYERFTADAERYFNRTSAEVPFVNFFAYMPQYSQMSQDQLRWYLYWRDNVRHGVYLATDYSYIFLYIYEILNLPEKIKPAQGLTMLCELWLAYREQFPRLDRYLGEWVCDYCLIHGLPAPLDTLSGILPTLVFLAAVTAGSRGLILLWNAAVAGSVSWMLFSAGAFVGVAFLGVVSVLFPVLSRFENSTAGLLRNTVLLALGNLPRTLGLGLLNAVTVFLCVRFVFPLFFLPSLAALLGSLFIEPMFRPFMPEEDAAD